ncbi:MAG: Do family serine endopeptidase [Bacteroidota bacterium]
MSKIKTSLLSILAAATLFAGLHYTSGSDSIGNTLLSDESSDAASLLTVADSQPQDPPAGETSLQPLLDFNDAIVEITERTNQTVVTITTTRTVRQRMQSPFSLFFDDPRFDQEREFQQSGLGSGVIVSSEGYILTNNHVIDGADEIRIRTYEGEELEAEVVGTDPESDVAVLQVDETDLPAITIGNSDQLRVGELVLAIGSPLRAEFAHSVSMGVVSAKGRSDLRLSSYENYIQTDAAINPGNSGGALINMEGHLIGINTAIASRSGGNQGIGFAIPINMARSIMESLIDEGRVVRSYLGITQGALVDRVMARALGMEDDFGVVIGDVSSDSPAEKGGLAEGDVLLRMDGEPIREWSQFRLGVAHREPGTEVEFEVFRDGEILERSVTLEERPEEYATAEPVPDESREELQETLGFQVTELNDNIRQQLSLEQDVEGVVVTEVVSGSRAHRQGLQRGDVIFQVQQTPVGNESEFYGAIEQLRSSGQEVILLRIHRRGSTVYIAFEMQ